MVNACKEPGEWQTYDIIYTAPRFNEDGITYFTPPTITVLHNGVLVQNNVKMRGVRQNILEFLNILLKNMGREVWFYKTMVIL